MRAFLSVKYHADQSNRAHIEALAAALGSAGFECTCIVRDVEQWGQATLSPRDLMRRTCSEIADCQVLVADSAEKGVGLGIEAGYAHARSIPVITVAPENTDVSATLAGISFRVFHYQAPADLIPPLRDLAQAMNAIAGSTDAERTSLPHQYPGGSAVV